LITFNQSVGLNAGVSASWRIFDGQLINRNIQSSKINAEIIQAQKADMLNRIENQLTTSYFQYETDKKLLELEKENKEIAAENLSISLEKFKLGSSTILEINDAQTRYNTVLNRLVSAQFNVKISQLDLITISGQLMK
jgi:outer membrane protein TolC